VEDVERTKGGDSDGQHTNRRPEGAGRIGGSCRGRDRKLRRRQRGQRIGLGLSGLTKADGTPVTVYVNKQFEVVSVETR
jgi:hypothetical protein